MPPLVIMEVGIKVVVGLVVPKGPWSGTLEVDLGLLAREEAV